MAHTSYSYVLIAPRTPTTIIMTTATATAIWLLVLLVVELSLSWIQLSQGYILICVSWLVMIVKVTAAAMIAV
jgi:hypothetical protein